MEPMSGASLFKGADEDDNAPLSQLLYRIVFVNSQGREPRPILIPS